MRARGVSRLLKAKGIRILRVWEHRLRTETGRREVVDEIFSRIISNGSRGAGPIAVEYDAIRHP
jgi:very-short-patch-repair endonuclease